MLDFSSYDAKAVFAAQLAPNDEVAANAWTSTASTSATLTWGGLADGDKYITLTRVDGSTATEYKVEQWTVVGASADAYATTSDDRSELIGYVDLGKEIEGIGTAGLNEVLDHVIL
jgi:hypothetical protein